LRKALSSILVLVLLLGMVIPASAAGTPTLSISSGEVKAGESVTLTVSIEDNPGIAISLLYIYFDTDVFSVDIKKDIDAIGIFGKSGDVIGNSIEQAKLIGSYDGEPGKDGVIALWYNGSGVDTDGDGDLLEIVLHTKSDAANGSHIIKVEQSLMDTRNENGDKVKISAGSGTVKVNGGSDDKKDGTDNAGFVEFTDVSDHWAERYIWQSAELGLVEGYQGLYRPDDTMTRAEFVTIMWRAMGEPKPSKKASFTDLTQEWYLDAVAWAEENSVVNGMGDGLFAPNGSVTREQLVTILHRLAGSPMGMELMRSSIYDDQYSDSGQIGDWAKASLYWSIYEGIYCGENAEEIGSTLAPKSAANRAQIAVMMIRYLNEQ